MDFMMKRPPPTMATPRRATMAMMMVVLESLEPPSLVITVPWMVTSSYSSTLSRSGFVAGSSAGMISSTQTMKVKVPSKPSGMS